MVRLSGRTLTPEQVAAVAAGERVALAPAALARVRRSHALLLRAAKERVVYGVNTGFGPMADRLIGGEDLETLQRNLILSHACGAGEPVPEREVAAAMVVRLNTLLRGDSGVSPELLALLAALINARVTPVIPERGGVGASGDLIQLAHIALSLIGEGEVVLRGARMSTKRALKQLRLKPHVLRPKEGLALINGTSFMTGVAALVLLEAEHIMSSALRQSALALEVCRAYEDCLDPYLHAARPHPGQVAAARALRTLVRGGALTPRTAVTGAAGARLARTVQDPYSLRCAPQVLGPALETLARVRATVGVELNAATDNPLVAPDGRLLHGGNFHGEYIAHAMDTLKASLAKVSILCERRLNFLLHERLNAMFPPFLNLGTPGLTLGLQGLQFVATSTAALNQTLGYPHALHSTPTNADNQDIVSMGADAARLCMQVAHNASGVCAAELVALSHAAVFTKPASRAGSGLVSRIRRTVPLMHEDRPLTSDIRKLAAAVRCGELGPNVVKG